MGVLGQGLASESFLQDDSPAFPRRAFFVSTGLVPVVCLNAEEMQI